MGMVIANTRTCKNTPYSFLGLPHGYSDHSSPLVILLSHCQEFTGYASHTRITTSMGTANAQMAPLLGSFTEIQQLTCIISDDQRILSAVNSYYLSVPYWLWIIPTLIATMKMGGTRRERQNIRHCLEYAWFLPHPRRKNSHHFLLMLLKTTTNMR